MDGKQVKLAGPEATFAQAKRALGAARSGAPRPVEVGPASALTMGDAVNLFLAECEEQVARGDRSPASLRGYEFLLIPAGSRFRDLPAADLREDMVARWLDEHRWGPTTRACAIRAVKACLKRMVKLRRLAEVPIADMVGPRPRKRDYAPGDDDYATMVAATPDRAFRDFLDLMARTGCRPGEIRHAEAKDVDLEAGTLRVRNKTRHRTGEQTRIVPLSEDALKRVGELCRERPEGPLLRNTRGDPWKHAAIRARFLRLRRRTGLPAGAVAYSLRHAFVTRALEAGVPIAAVAEIVGHKSVNMIMQCYSKLGQKTSYLRNESGRVKLPGDETKSSR